MAFEAANRIVAESESPDRRPHPGVIEEILCCAWTDRMTPVPSRARGAPRPGSVMAVAAALWPRRRRSRSCALPTFPSRDGGSGSGRRVRARSRSAPWADCGRRDCLGADRCVGRHGLRPTRLGETPCSLTLRSWQPLLAFVGVVMCSQLRVVDPAASASAAVVQAARRRSP
jgi:hypothetical protein